MKAALIIGVALLTAACVSKGEIEGHRITATAKIPEKPIPDLYEEAPEEAREVWRRYLAHAQGRYAVLAVDRKARGYYYIYCNPGYGGLCDMPGNQGSAFKDANYKYPALEGCRQNVRGNYPAVKPDCAIFAIRDKIVWKGPMPWE